MKSTEYNKNTYTKKNKDSMRKILFLMILIVLLIASVVIAKADTPLSGTCGPNAYWEIQLGNVQKLVITGTGPMTSHPWNTPSGNDEELVLQAIEIGNGITSICDFAFRSSDATQISIPDSVVSIGQCAFSNSDYLQTVTLGSGVASIGDNCFSRCISLSSIRVNSANSTFSSNNGVLFTNEGKTLLIFPPAKNRGTYTVPSGVTEIAARAFSYGGNSSVLNISLSNTVITIGEDAFHLPIADFDILERRKVTLSTSVTSVGQNAFSEIGILRYMGGKTGYNAIRGIESCGYCYAVEFDIISVESVDLDTSKTINKGNRGFICAELYPANPTNMNVSWSSNHPEIATVEQFDEWSGNGRIYASVYGHAPGECTITVTTADGGFTASCDVVVISRVTEVNLVRDDAFVETGSTVSLAYNIFPSDASNKRILWSSDKESIATVDENGVITGISEGTATITATTEDGGFTDSAAVHVFEGNDHSDQYVLLFDKAVENGQVQVETMEELSFTAYVPGARSIIVSVKDENGRTLYSYDQMNRDYLKTDGNWTPCTNQTLQILLEGTRNGESYSIQAAEQIVVSGTEGLPTPIVQSSVQCGFYQRGTAIRFSFSIPETVDLNGIVFSRYVLDANNQIISDGEDLEPGQNYGFYISSIEPGETYRLRVSAQKQGYVEQSTDIPFEAIPNYSSRVQMTIADTYPAYVDVPYTVTATDATLVQVYNGEKWISSGMKENIFTETLQSPPGKRMIVARASWDPNGTLLAQRNWQYSCAVIADVTAENAVPTPFISLNNVSSTFVRGDCIQLTLTEGQLSDALTELTRTYMITIRNEEKTFYTLPVASYEMTDGTALLSVPTAAMPAGDYYTEVVAMAPGCTGCTVRLDFTVEGEGETTQEGIHIYASANRTITGGHILLSAYAPGADRIELMHNGRSTKAGDFITYSLTSDIAREFEVYAEAIYGSRRVKSEEPLVIVFEANQQAEKLSDPNVSFNKLLLGANDNLTIVVDTIPNAKTYGLKIYDWNAGEKYGYIYSVNDTTPFNLTIPREMFITGHTYSVTVSASAPGFIGSESNYSIVAGQSDSANSVKLTINGQVTPTYVIPVNRYDDVIVTAPSNATAVGLLVDGWWDNLPGNIYNGYVGYGSVVTNQLVMGRYTTDPINGDPEDPDFDWDSLSWTYSNSVTVSSTAIGQLIPIQYSLSKDEYIQGEYVIVELTNIDNMLASIQEQAEAYGIAYDSGNLNIICEITARNEQGYYNSYSSKKWEGNNQIFIPTTSLKLPKMENRARIYIRAALGEGWTSSTAEGYFNIRNTKESVFTALKTQLETAESTELSLLIPGASRVSIWQVDGDTEQLIYWKEGNNLVRKVSFGSAGSYTLKAKIQEGDHGDAWSEAWLAAWEDAETDSIILTVNANTTDQPLTGSVAVNSRQQPNTSLQVQYTCNPDPEQIEITIWQKEDNKCVWHSIHSAGSDIRIPYIMPNPEYMVYTLDPILPEGAYVLSNTKIYRIEVSMWKRGWEQYSTESYFTVYSRLTETRELILPNELSVIEEEAFSNIRANWIIIGSEVQSISQRAFAELQGLVYVDFGSNSDVIIDEYAFDQTNAIFLCAEGSTAQNFAKTNGYPYELK